MALKHPQLQPPPQPMPKKTNAAAMPDQLTAASAQTVASAVDAMVAEVAVAAMSAVIVQKVARTAGGSHARMDAPKIVPKVAVKFVQTAEAMIVLNAVMINAIRSRETVSPVASNAAMARSHASRAHPVSHVKVVARSAHVANAANAMNEAVSNAHQRMPQSKTLPRPTRLPWLRPWVARQPKVRKMHRAVNVVNVVAATTVVLTCALIARNWVIQRPSQWWTWTVAPPLKTRHKRRKVIKLTSNARHADVAIAMAANAANAMTALKELNASQTALKPRFFPIIQ